MAKDNVDKKECPNCEGKGQFKDEGKTKTCPCQALKD